MLRWSAEHAVSTRPGAGSAIRLSIVRRDVSTSGFSVVDPTTTSIGDAGNVNVGVIVVGDGGGDIHDDNSSFNSVNGVPRYESVDASATRDVREIVPGRDIPATKRAVDPRRHIRLSLRRFDHLPRQHDLLRMVGQRDLAPSTGTIRGPADTRSTCPAVLHPATGGDSWRRHPGLRVDLVAGSGERVSQTVALQTAAVQMLSGVRRALLQPQHR